MPVRFAGVAGDSVVGAAVLACWCGVFEAELSVVLEHAPRVVSAMMHAAEMIACFMGFSGAIDV